MEKHVDISILKQKIIKTDELFKLYIKNNEDHEKTQKICKTLKQKLEECTNELKIIKIKNETLQHRSEYTEKRYKPLKEEHDKLQIEFTELQKHSNATINDLQVKYQTANQQLLDLQQNIDKEPTPEPVRGRKKVCPLEAMLKIEENQSELETKNVEFQKENSELKQQLDDIKKQLILSQKEKAKLVLELNKFKKHEQEVCLKKSEIKQLQETHNNFIKDKNKEIKQLKSELERLKNVEIDLEGFREKYGVLKMEMELLQNNHTENKCLEELEKLRKELELTKNKLISSENKNKQLENLNTEKGELKIPENVTKELDLLKNHLKQFEQLKNELEITKNELNKNKQMELPILEEEKEQIKIGNVSKTVLEELELLKTNQKQFEEMRKELELTKNELFQLKTKNKQLESEKKVVELPILNETKQLNNINIPETVLEELKSLKNQQKHFEQLKNDLELTKTELHKFETKNKQLEILKSNELRLFEENNQLKLEITAKILHIKELEKNNNIPTDYQIEQIFQEQSVPLLISPFTTDDDEDENNTPNPEINEQFKRDLMALRRKAKQKRLKKIHRKRLNNKRNKSPKIDLLATLIKLREANINFTISNEPILELGQPSNIYSSTEIKTNKDSKIFEKKLGGCISSDCVNSYVLLKGDDEKNADLLGFFGVKPEPNSRSNSRIDGMEICKQFNRISTKLSGRRQDSGFSSDCSSRLEDRNKKRRRDLYQKRIGKKLEDFGKDKKQKNCEENEDLVSDMEENIDFEERNVGNGKRRKVLSQKKKSVKKCRTEQGEILEDFGLIHKKHENKQIGDCVEMVEDREFCQKLSANCSRRDSVASSDCFDISDEENINLEEQKPIKEKRRLLLNQKRSLKKCRTVSKIDQEEIPKDPIKNLDFNNKKREEKQDGDCKQNLETEKLNKNQNTECSRLNSIFLNDSSDEDNINLKDWKIVNEKRKQKTLKKSQIDSKIDQEESSEENSDLSNTKTEENEIENCQEMLENEKLNEDDQNTSCSRPKSLFSNDSFNLSDEESVKKRKVLNQKRKKIAPTTRRLLKKCQLIRKATQKKIVLGDLSKPTIIKKPMQKKIVIKRSLEDSHVKINRESEKDVNNSEKIEGDKILESVKSSQKQKEDLTTIDIKEFEEKNNNPEKINAKVSENRKIIINPVKIKSPKTSYKRPVCRTRHSPRLQIKSPTLPIENDSPMSPPHSPEPENIPINLTPLIIPLEKISETPLTQNLAISRMDMLLKELINFANSDEIVTEIVDEFLNQPPNWIVRSIFETVALDNIEKPIIKSNEFAVLTTTQRILIGFMSKLEKRGCFVFDCFMELVEVRILNGVVQLDEIDPIARLYLAICKIRKNIHRIRRFCCDVFYHCGDLAVPFLFAVLPSWTEILPHNIYSAEEPLVRVIVQIVHLKQCNKPGYNLRQLKDLLHKYYMYPVERWNSDEMFQEMYNRYLKNPCRISSIPLLLLCKNHPEKWVKEKIDEYFTPFVDKIPNENFKATVIILVGNLCSRFSCKSKPNYLPEIRSWFKGLINDDSPDLIQRSVQFALDKIK